MDIIIKLLCTLWLCLCSVAWGMPVVLDESHAAAYGAVVKYMGVDGACRLLLIDKHCDANIPEDVEGIRTGVRRVVSLAQREERVQEYRRAGKIQCYNWLTPLMPLPVCEVYWLTEDEAIAYEYLTPELAGRWFGADTWEDLPQDVTLPWVVSIDLDAFSDSPDPVAELRETWKRVIGLPNVQLITVCASTPWQKDTATAQALFDEAVTLARRTHPADVIIGSDVGDAPDDSRRAQELDGDVPRVQVVAEEEPEIAIRREKDGRLTACPDGHWEQEWVQYKPHRAAANLFTRIAEGRAFAGELAPSALLWEEVRRIPVEDGQLAASQVPLGTSWWRVEAKDGSGAASATAPTVIVRAEGDGMHAALSSRLGVPYMFGAGLVAEGRFPVAMTPWGNDCANYVAAAARDCGARIPCVNPLQIRDYLEPYTGGAFTDLVYHAGNHVAALWEDKPPLGEFGPEDVVIHHLGDYPELMTRKAFEEKYPRARYETFAWKREPLTVAAVGDISPAPGGIAGELPQADLVLANFEGSLDVGGDKPHQRYPQLGKPGEVADMLRGVDCVSLANNHIMDGGPQGLEALCKELDAAGVRYVGIGHDPVILEKNGLKLAIWGVQEGAVPENIYEYIDDVDQVIVMVHWGEEMTTTPTDAQREHALKLAQAGVDIVLGSHPHVWQEPFTIGLTRIYPSLGNWRFYPVSPAFDARRHILLLLGPDHRRSMEGK